MFSKIIQYKNRYRLSYRLLLYVVLCSSLWTLLATGFQLYFDFQKDINAIHSNIQFIKDSYLEAITQSVYRFDEEQSTILLQGALKTIGVEYLEITDSSKKYKLSVGNSNASKDLVRIISMEVQDPLERTVSVGTLTIIASFDEVYQQLLEKAVFILFSNIFKTFFASIFILVIIQLMVSRHLSKMANYTEDINIDENDQYLVLNRRTSLSQRDELDQLVDAINDMQARLRDDITTRKQLESQLTQSAKIASLGSWDCDLLTNKEIWSEEFYHILGFDPEETNPTHETFLTSIFPEDLEFVKNEIKKSLDIPQYSREMEFRIVRKTDEIRFVRSQVEIQRDQQNQPIRMIGIIQDITDRKLVEEEVIQYEHIVSSSTDMIALLDKQFVYLAANEAYRNAVQLSSQELIGKTPADIFGEEFFEAVIKPNVLRCLTGEKVSYHAWIIFPADEKKYVEISYYPYLGLKKEIKGFVVNLRDITEQNQLETQLRHSQKMDAIGTLAGGIAHEFNNILSIILGYSSLLLRKLPENHAEKHYINNIHEAGKRGAGLTKQILTFSRMDDQILSLQHIAPLLKETIKMMRATIPVNIDIQQEIDINCSPILADSSQLHQVLVNLCTNAFHAMEKHGGVLKICLQEGNDPKFVSVLKAESYLKLTVSDTGCGIPVDAQEKIFDPFFTTKAVGEGTGLGLSVVHSIVEKHHGIITVESAVRNLQQPGGTIFYIYFPVARGDVKEEHVNEIVLPRGKGSILVVDDEEILANLHKEVLQDQGYTVTACNHELEALKLFQQNPDQFDLVFTDYTMPYLTGDLFSLQLLELRPDIPIILATGYSSKISEERAKSLGIQAFLMKPVEAETLVQTVQRLLEK